MTLNNDLIVESLKIENISYTKLSGIIKNLKHFKHLKFREYIKNMKFKIPHGIVFF